MNNKVGKIFLDSAPVIYWVQGNPKYQNALEVFFNALDNHSLQAVISPVTLAECLVIPLVGEGDSELALNQQFISLLTKSPSIFFSNINQQISLEAARVRKKFKMSLNDSFQIATALLSGCSQILTNDFQFKRLSSEIDICIVDELL